MTYASPDFDVQKTSLFQVFPLSDEDRSSLAQLSLVRKTYQPHTDIIKEGDGGGRIFLVRSGWTALYRLFRNGERQIIDFPVPGDLVGLDGAATGARQSLMAITDVVVYETSIAALVATIARSERLTAFVVEEEARQRAIVVEHLTNLGYRSALARVAHLLLELRARLSPMGLAGPTGYRCPLTQYDLADALGLTAIHVNRMLRDLRQADLLHFHKGFVGILDDSRLASLAGFECDYLTRQASPLLNKK